MRTTFEVRDTLLHVSLLQVDPPDPVACNAEAEEVIDRLSGPDRFHSMGDSLGKLTTFGER